MIGPMTNPEKPNRMIPPSIERKMSRGCISTSLPMRMGRSRLSTVLITKTPTARIKTPSQMWPVRSIRDPAGAQMMEQPTHGDDGRQDHQEPPYQRPLDIGRDKDEPPEYSLDAADDQRHLQGGARRHDEAFIKETLPPHPQVAEPHRHPEKFLPVADEEKEGVEHDGHLYDQADGVLRQLLQVDEDVVRDSPDDLRRLFDQEGPVDTEQIGEGIVGESIDDVPEVAIDVLRIRLQGFIELEGFPEDDRPDDKSR